MKTANSKLGFALIEALIAIFVLTIGILAGYALMQSNLVLISQVQSRLIGAYLTQEGIEIVRNIRDTNWLEGGTNPWDEGLAGCSVGCIVDYNHTNQLDPNLPVYANQYLNIDANGFYSYSPGALTKFKRRITISSSLGGYLEITSRAEWQDRGRDYYIQALTHLYNWYGSP